MVAPKVIPRAAHLAGRSPIEVEKILQLRETQMSYVFTSTVMKRFTVNHPANLHFVLFALRTIPLSIDCQHLCLTPAGIPAGHVCR
eukprot:scaffold159075_cov47-Prasinocladus_malaysianus.AAC.1